MKNTFFMLFFSIAISFIACGGSGENDENLLAGNGNTEKPKEDESQEPVVCSITPIGELNQGTPIINSHADVTKRSSLMMNYRMLVTMESSYPRYPRIKKMKNGDYILFYHNGSANNNIGRRCVYALSKDLKTWSIAMLIAMGWCFLMEIYWQLHLAELIPVIGICRKMQELN